MLALRQQNGEMAATTLPETFHNEEQTRRPETDTPVVVRITAAKRWLARIQHQGREHTFTLRAKSKSAAVTEAGIVYEAIRSVGWEAAQFIYSTQARPKECSSRDENTIGWQARLELRRYTFPPAGGSGKDWAVRLEYAGMGYWFPLGDTDQEVASGKARRIYQTLSDLGWNAVCSLHPRELILNFEWCSSPVLWTYTTIHTLVGPRSLAALPALPKPGSVRVLVVETDDGIRRALEWCVNQQAGFQSVACAAPEIFSQLCSFHKPSFVLLNRSLAKGLGLESSGGIIDGPSGMVIVGYSVSADGDQMFVSTPADVEGYMLKRVGPANVFDPVMSAVRRANARAEDFIGSVKCYFKELLHSRLDAGTRSLARLTPRENDVLRLLSTGCSDREIARAMGISFWTVHGHLKKIFRRLDVRTRTEAVARYWGGSWEMPAPAVVPHA